MIGLDCSVVADIDKWMSSNRLKINADKTEFLWIGSRQQQLKVHNQPLLVGGQLVSPVKSARNLGVLLDAELTMDVQASAVVKGCVLLSAPQCATIAECRRPMRCDDGFRRRLSRLLQRCFVRCCKNHYPTATGSDERCCST